MNYSLCLILFWLFFAILLSLIIWLNRTSNLLRDDIANSPKTADSKIIRTYSLASVQLVWWTLIIIPCFAITVICKGEIPAVSQTLLVLLGITGGTAALSKAVDGSADPKTDPTNQTTDPQKNTAPNLFSDMMSTGEGAGVHRLQVIIFNLIFGIWFLFKTLENLSAQFADKTKDLKILADIPLESLALLGISAAIYTSMKTSEKKPA